MKGSTMATRSRSFWLTKARRWAGRWGSLWVLGALFFCGSCGSAAPAGPLVRIHLASVDPSASRALLNVTARDATFQSKSGMTEFRSGPFDVLGVAFPPGTQGPTSINVSLYKDETCLLGTGTTMLNLESDGVFEVWVDLVAPPLSCGTPAAKLSIQVITGAMSAGLVTSQPAGISCTGNGTNCTFIFEQGTQVTLHAQAASGMGNFISWSGSGINCPGVNDCIVTLNADTEVQALFASCSGWCAEPSGTTKDLYSVWGIPPNNVVAVGQGGTIIKWDGTAWKSEPSGTTRDLHAVQVPRDGNSQNYVVTGDGGLILVGMGANGFSQVTSSTTQNLMAVGGVTDNAIYAAGVAGTVLKGSLSSFAAPTGGETPPSGSANKNFNALSIQVNPLIAGTGQYLLVGDAGYTLFYVGANNWDQTQPSGVSANLYGAWFSRTRMVAVGANGTILSRIYSLGWQGWKPESSPVSGIAFRGAWGAAEDNIYVVGDSGKILHWDGKNWSAVTSSPTTQNLYAIWGTGPNNIYAVGQGGTLLHFVQ